MHRSSHHTRRAEMRVLLAALFLSACLAAGGAACGSGDLTFPGNFPATQTSVNTATPEPTET